MNVDVHMCFIDYGKAFDCLQHDKLIQILVNQDIDKKNLRIIIELLESNGENKKK